MFQWINNRCMVKRELISLEPFEMQGGMRFQAINLKRLQRPGRTPVFPPQQ